MIIKKKSQFMLFVALLALVVSCAKTEVAKTGYLFSYFKGNGEDGLHLAYSSDGLKWTSLKSDKPFLTPEVGEAKLMRDPCVVQGPDGMFHMVWTAGWWEKGIGVAHSIDLIEWSPQELVPVMAHEPEAINCWAPEIYYDAAIKQYVIFWATTIPGRFPETEVGGDAVRDTGAKLNHRIYYVTTKDFQKYSDTKILYNDGFNVIDATIVKEGEKYVMFLKDETRYPEPEKNIRIATSDHILGPWSSASQPITGDYWAEGPTAVKIGNQWYVYFDKYTNHQYGVIASDNLERWTDLSDKLQVPSGIRHGTIFEVDAKVIEKLQTIQ